MSQQGLETPHGAGQGQLGGGAARCRQLTRGLHRLSPPTRVRTLAELQPTRCFLRSSLPSSPNTVEVFLVKKRSPVPRPGIRTLLGLVVLLWLGLGQVSAQLTVRPQQTVCPAELTKCPVVETTCPVVQTRCPEFETRCPVVQTKCPSWDTYCPEIRTRCPVRASRAAIVAV